MRLVSALCAVLAGFLLTACTDDTPDYRYRLTVKVDTPQGVRTGSSVIAVEQSMGRTAMSGFGERVERRVRGEAVAVAVDLPGGRTLFALLRSEDNSDWAGYILQWLAPAPGGEEFAEQLDNMLALEERGPIPVPRTYELWRGQPPVSAYPMLVTFGDPGDPTSVAAVDSDNLAATFGPGTALRRITVEMTDEAVTEGIEGRLGWLGKHPEPRLDPNYTGSTNPNLSQSLWHGDFIKRGE